MMKILVAHDGSHFSDAAIVELKYAGLPQEADVVVISVADSAAGVTVPYTAVEAGGGSSLYQRELETPDYEYKKCEDFAAQAADQLRAEFPGWHVGTETWVDSPTSAIVRKAHGWTPDLIVVGSHGHSCLSHQVLGSVCHHILHNTHCSVRVCRHRPHSEGRVTRLVIGIDGSPGAMAAARAVAQRKWPAGTEARLVGVVHPQAPVLAALLTQYNASPTTTTEQSHRSMLAASLNSAATVLREAGLLVTFEIVAGKAGAVLIEEAERFGADCIFVGARGSNLLKRMLLGDVSEHVACHANCSVEVVRTSLHDR